MLNVARKVCCNVEELFLDLQQKFLKVFPWLIAIALPKLAKAI
jgi:hypothetical protein